MAPSLWAASCCPRAKTCQTEPAFSQVAVRRMHRDQEMSALFVVPPPNLKRDRQVQSPVIRCTQVSFLPDTEVCSQRLGDDGRTSCREKEASLAALLDATPAEFLIFSLSSEKPFRARVSPSSYSPVLLPRPTPPST